jgi:hypothetical protein
MVANGVHVRMEGGGFDLKDSMRRYAEHLRKAASGRAGAEATYQLPGRRACKRAPV